MILVLVAGGFSGWKARRASIQRRAVATIQASGGSVCYDYNYASDQTFLPNGSPRAPAWLRRIAGDELFREVVAVQLRGSVANDWLQGADDALTALESLDQVWSLGFRDVVLRVDQAERISHDAGLRSIDFSSSPVRAEHLERLGRLANLEALTLGSSETVSVAFWKALRPFNKLKTLIFWGDFQCSTEELAGIRLPPNLETLLLPNMPLDGAFLDHIAGLKKLEQLILPRTDISDEQFKRLGENVRLKDLMFGGSSLTGEGFQTVKAWPLLETLTLRGPLARLDRKLMSAGVGHLNDSNLDQLRGCPRLRELSLVGHRFSDAGVAALASLPKLVRLDLHGFDATVAGFRPFLAGRQLESLALHGPGVTDALLPLFGGQAKLFHLRLGGPNLTDTGMQILSTLPRLDSLDLSNSKVTDAGLAHLTAGVAPPVDLDLSGTAVTSAGVEAFHQAHRGCQVYIDNPVEKP